MKKTILSLLLSINFVHAQIPELSYTTPNNFNVNEPISPLLPSNSGGEIVAGRIVSTFAGSGNVGSSNGNGILASFNLPTVVTLDALGNVFVIDRINNKIRKITPNGDVTTFAGSGASGSSDGPNATATFKYPDGGVFDSQGNLFISDQSNHKIRKITTEGIVSTFAGTGAVGNTDGEGNIAKFHFPAGMAVDEFDNLYIADYGNNKIRKITPEGIVSTFAGTGEIGSTDGEASISKFNGATGVCVDGYGNVYVADYYNNKIRKINSLGEVSTIAGTGVEGSNDGPGLEATFHYPAIVTVDADNNLFITDQQNNKIRKIDLSNNVSTFAGIGTAGNSDGFFDIAQFSEPTGITIDTNNNVYVCDYGNNKIRKINNYGYTITPDLPEGLTFDTITGIVSGTPTSSFPPTDFTVIGNNSFGSSSFTLTIAVNVLNIEDFNQNRVKLYPNPAQNILSLSSEESISEIKIYSLLGQELYSENNLSSEAKIRVNDLEKGCYIISIKIGEMFKIEKFIKE